METVATTIVNGITLYTLTQSEDEPALGAMGLGMTTTLFVWAAAKGSMVRLARYQHRAARLTSLCALFSAARGNLVASTFFVATSISSSIFSYSANRAHAKE
ncbi:MAG: hypothetical protein MRY21_06845 [Simkaniaceae bacterium]|nr:hypothetical protein [Simkaniaceae bacterium]